MSGYKVSFTNKNGTPGSAVFPSEALANAYAKTVKNASVAPVEAPVAEVSVKACPAGTAEAQASASRAYYRSWKSAPKPARVEREVDESRSERMMEHFNACHLAGVSSEDAWADWDYMEGR